MSAHITVVRNTARLGATKRFEIIVDDVVVARLKRGQARTIPLEPGSHSVQASYGDVRKSPRVVVNLADGEERTLHVAHVSERAHQLKPPYRDTDWLVLTGNSESEAITGGLPTTEDRLLLALGVLSGLALLASVVAPAHSVLRPLAFAVLIVVVAAALPLVVRQLRRSS
ncbi:hypothetical protein [Rhodococcus sp. X156]|uniref:hypothetical protein n=1 Tax=Rhodococcus sp. X156 TaxID=2499145 RepID=UPI000FDCD4D5|nr:hypothetical protein [Rhodococcus sp. X156]